MSELRDSNFVTELAKGLGIDTQIEKEVSLEICSQVEIELRSLIEVNRINRMHASDQFHSYLYFQRTLSSL